MAEPNPSSPGDGSACRFLTFRWNARLYALPAGEVSEVIRVPQVARVPYGPRCLLGVANLRGSVLPVASLGGLLGKEMGEPPPTARAIVLAGSAPVALVVDSIEALVSVEHVETTQAMMAAEPGERLQGGFRTGVDQPVVKILDIQKLLASAFARKVQPKVRTVSHQGAVGQATTNESADFGKLVSFEVASQEYALALEDVREIIPVPDSVTLVPHSEALILGVATYRDTLLPLFSLRGLLGFSPPSGDSQGKIVVSIVGGSLVGLVADRMRAIITADPGLIEPTPPVLAARAGGEARIRAIYRGEAGKRLISILAPEALFREEIMERLGQTSRACTIGETAPKLSAGETVTLLVIRLGDEEFGLPIAVVDEVTRVPAQITRVPNTPDFLEGVVNLRGEVLLVVDQRRRFGMPALEDGTRRRLVVVRTADRRAGLIVDSVSEVLRSDAGAVMPAPDLTGETTQLVTGVVNLEQAGRMILILDPAELLTRAEQGILDTFQSDAEALAGGQAVV